MIRLTLICDDCNVDRMAEAFNLDDLDLDVVPDDWIETPAGKIYCADCKMKHGAELVEVGTNVEIEEGGRIEKREGATVDGGGRVDGLGEGGAAGQENPQSLAGEPETKAQSESAAGPGAGSDS